MKVIINNKKHYIINDGKYIIKMHLIQNKYTFSFKVYNYTLGFNDYGDTTKYGTNYSHVNGIGNLGVNGTEIVLQKFHDDNVMWNLDNYPKFVKELCTMFKAFKKSSFYQKTYIKPEQDKLKELAKTDNLPFK